MKALIFTMSSCGIRLGAWDYLQWGPIPPDCTMKPLLK